MKAQSQSLDRISALPQDVIENILTLMPIRDALRTSILSKKWRYSWTGMPKLALKGSQMVVPPDNEVLDQYKFANAIFHVLLLHRAPILEFRLFFDTFYNTDSFSQIDQIILYLSRSNSIKKFIFEVLDADHCPLPCSLFSLQGLEHLELWYSRFEHPSMNKGFSMLKTLRFYDMSIANEMVLGFLTNCPLLENFTWIRDHYTDIELTECEFVELFKCLPSIQVLEISHFNIKHLVAGSMPHKLPVSLVHLRILVLGMCYLELSSLLCVISSSPNLEKLKIEMCRDHDRGCLKLTLMELVRSRMVTIDQHDSTYDFDMFDLQDSLGHFKELEITKFWDDGCWMEFVKLVMARSPMLKKATIELFPSVSVDEEVEMLRDLVRMPFLRASPTANLICKRPK